MLGKASILITGGTGSFGRTFVEEVLKTYNVKQLVIYSRDEMKQWDMSLKYKDEPRVRFVIGDVRDRRSMRRALDGIDYVVHAAATKIVPTAEYNPYECIETNINGAVNLIDACIDAKIKRVVALSTDKASNPINLYGATKLAADKLFIAANAAFGDHNTSFSVVRYGNVMGSRGSVIPFFLSLGDSAELPITDTRMTRFMISLQEGVGLVLKAFEDMKGGEVYVKKIPSMTITDIATAVSPKASHKIIGIRPGEKIHEQMIGSEDAPYTLEYDGHYKILPVIHDWANDPERRGDGRPVPDDFTYSSGDNKEWMSVEELSAWINTYRDKIGKY